MGFSRQEYWSGVTLPSLLGEPTEVFICRVVPEETMVKVLATGPPSLCFLSNNGASLCGPAGCSVLPAPSPQPRGQVSSEAMVLHYEKAGAVLMNRNCHRTSTSDKVTL